MKMIIRLTTDPAYDQTAFEQLMEIKGNSDHSKLIEMLDVLNDESSSMDEEAVCHGILTPRILPTGWRSNC